MAKSKKIKNYFYNFNIKELVSIFRRFSKGEFFLKEIVAGKNLNTRETDVFLVSYPKSGNTWVRLLISNYLHHEQVSLPGVEAIIPDIYTQTNRKLASYPSPRILKSHEAYTPDYSKVIYIIRDPRDVVISFYWWHKETGFFNIPQFSHWSFKNYVEGFLCGAFPYMPWDDHVNSWLINQSVLKHGFLLIKYEDLLANTEKEFIKILNFLALPIDMGKLKSAIERSAFNTLKEMGGDKSKKFFRRGKRHQWDKQFDPELQKKYFERFKILLEQQDYL